MLLFLLIIRIKNTLYPTALVGDTSGFLMDGFLMVSFHAGPQVYSMSHVQSSQSNTKKSIMNLSLNCFSRAQENLIC